jgi:hypothetical protein
MCLNKFISFLPVKTVYVILFFMLLNSCFEATVAAQFHFYLSPFHHILFPLLYLYSLFFHFVLLKFSTSLLPFSYINLCSLICMVHLMSFVVV